MGALREREREEIVVPFPVPRETVRPATHFRSTWIVSSLESLRARGQFDEYRRHLHTHEETILSTLVGVWLPMDVARAHYDACNRLGLSVDEQFAMGAHVSDRMKGTLLASVVKTARSAGVTPWTVIPQLDRLCKRGTNGGSMAVYKLGPKEVRAEFIGVELFDVDYFRHAFRGVLHAVGSLFCEKGYIHDLPRKRRGEANFRMQWV